jgi:hypothetical protein
MAKKDRSNFEDATSDDSVPVPDAAPVPDMTGDAVQAEADARAEVARTHKPDGTPIADAEGNYEGKQHFPKMRYHATEAPRIVASVEEQDALEAAHPGWQDAPVVEPTPEAPPDLPGKKA